MVHLLHHGVKNSKQQPKSITIGEYLSNTTSLCLGMYKLTFSAERKFVLWISLVNVKQFWAYVVHYFISLECLLKANTFRESHPMQFSKYEAIMYNVFHLRPVYKCFQDSSFAGKHFCLVGRYNASNRFNYIENSIRFKVFKVSQISADLPTVCYKEPTSESITSECHDNPQKT